MEKFCIAFGSGDGGNLHHTFNSGKVADQEAAEKWANETLARYLHIDKIVILEACQVITR